MEKTAERNCYYHNIAFSEALFVQGTVYTDNTFLEYTGSLPVAAPGSQTFSFQCLNVLGDHEANTTYKLSPVTSQTGTL